jgi:hypothetical protein
MTTSEMELRGLNEVRMGKDELLRRIKANRDEHRKIYEEAMEGWKRSVIETLEKAYQDALEGKDFRVGFRLERPEDHSDEYDTVIELLGASLDDEFELTYQQFSNYVLDKWGWQQGFLTSASFYGSTTAMSKDSI